jgi:predicted transcriptional regulator
MNAHTSITAPLDAATLAMVEEIAQAQGISGERFAADAIRTAAEREMGWRAFVQEGIDSADRGELISQEEMKAWFEQRIAARRKA